MQLSIDFPIEGGETKHAELVLPDFQYEYIEDTPARLFHQVNYGTGHIFRQCIGNSEIDFRRYDEIFYLTKREDAAETVLLLAMSRLRYPYRLQEKHREVYLDYLRSICSGRRRISWSRRRGKTLRLFADWGLLTAETTPELIALAQKKGQTAVLSFLMDYQHRHLPQQGKRKHSSYDFLWGSTPNPGRGMIPLHPHLQNHEYGSAVSGRGGAPLVGV